MPGSEVWRDITGYEGLYQVSNKGNIYSVERIGANGRKFGGVTLKPRYTRDGYLQVSLCKNGKIKNKYTHRLVAEAFIPNPKSFLEINHLDEVKDNNELSNLEWCDSSYNNNYGTRIRRIAQKNYKKVRAVNVETGEVIIYSSATEARNKGFAIGAVSEACRGSYKSGTGKLIGDGHLYKGHQWSYEQKENKI